jgi:type IVB pilus formation R64 PilN family outer membrane protein
MTITKPIIQRTTAPPTSAAGIVAASVRGLTPLMIGLILAGCSSPPQSIVERTLEHRETTERRARVEQGPTMADQAGPVPRGSQASADQAARAQAVPAVVRRSSKPWLGSTMVPATSEDRLPSVFGEEFSLDFSDLSEGGRVSLPVVAVRISKLSGVPVRVSADVFNVSRTGGGSAGSSGPVGAGGAGGMGTSAGSAIPLGGAPMRITPGMPVPMNAVSQTQTFTPGKAGLGGNSMAPSGAGSGAPMARTAGASGVVREPVPPSGVLSQMDPITVNSVEMRWRGSLTGYLNMLTDSLGLAWEYRDNTVVISRFVQELHEIAAFQGGTKFQMSSSGTGGGAGGGAGASNAAAASMDVSESGESDPMQSIEKTIREMLADSPGSSVTRTDGSGRLMVKATREMQSRVRDYIRTENIALRRQATIQFDLYSIILEEGDQRGVNWSLILRKAGEGATLALGVPSALASSLTGTAAVNVLPNVEGNKLSELLGNSALFLQMLNQQGFNAQHRPISMLTMNRQWGRISRNSTEYYLSETTPGPASTTGVGAPGLKTDKVTTGDQILAMPQIMDDSTILLKFGISLSDLLGLFDVSVGQGNLQQKIQAPKVSAVNAQFPVSVRPGEVVVVTGLSRTVAISDNQRLVEGASLATGGARKTSLKREHFIVFVRPTLM